MHAAVGYLPGFVQFANEEDFPVRHCKLGLYMRNGDAYVLVWPALAAHSDTGPITVDSFIKLDTTTGRTTGERFNVDVKPDATMMFCDSPTGETIGGGSVVK